MVELSSASRAMERYAAGDDSAFGEVYDVVAPRLYDFLLAQTRNRALAEDLMQQTFLQMHRARGSFAAGAEVRPWAFAIARRLMIDGLRRTKREKAHLSEETYASADKTAEPPDQVASARQLADRMSEVLEHLPESQRTAFVLTKQHGLSLAEAAQVLGTTVVAVKLRAHRAALALKALVGEGFVVEGSTEGTG
jgi:RNA polymerase sigma-70 factor (ECF subfamily)